jgi:hypothetical protein
MAIQSLADFYESWFPTTSLRQTLEQGIGVKRFQQSYKQQTKTPQSRQAYIDELLGGFKTRALSGDPNQLMGYAIVRDYASDKGINVPTYQEFYDQLATAYGGYLDTAATNLETELKTQEERFSNLEQQFTAETEIAKAEAVKAERAALVAKRLTNLAQQRQNQQTVKQAAEQSTAVQTGVSRNVRQPKQIGQPGVQVTRVSKAAVGGYGGTAPGRINPTGLNI